MLALKFLYLFGPLGDVAEHADGLDPVLGPPGHLGVEFGHARVWPFPVV